MLAIVSRPHGPEPLDPDEWEDILPRPQGPARRQPAHPGDGQEGHPPRDYPRPAQEKAGHRPVHRPRRLPTRQRLHRPGQTPSRRAPGCSTTNNSPASSPATTTTWPGQPRHLRERHQRRPAGLSAGWPPACSSAASPPCSPCSTRSTSRRRASSSKISTPRSPTASRSTGPSSKPATPSPSTSARQPRVRHACALPALGQRLRVCRVKRYKSPPDIRFGCRIKNRFNTLLKIRHPPPPRGRCPHRLRSAPGARPPVSGATGAW
jgi:hypothetical protein